MAHPLTVLIPCKDEAHNIVDCIESAKSIADEILVADSGSTDGTLELVRSRGDCRVIEREYVNPADFKNWAIPQARHPWVLVLDADERVTPELATEIRAILQHDPPHRAYAVRRDTYVLGYRLRYSGAQTATCTRLIARDLRYRECRVHEDIDIAPTEVGPLRGKLEHHTCQSLDRMFATQNRYTTWAALDAAEAGKRIAFWQVIVRPPLRFLQFYFLRLGVLDGRVGLLWCVMAAYYNFCKLAKQWELAHSRVRSGGPPTAQAAAKPARRAA